MWLRSRLRRYDEASLSRKSRPIPALKGNVSQTLPLAPEAPAHFFDESRRLRRHRGLSPGNAPTVPAFSTLSQATANRPLSGVLFSVLLALAGSATPTMAQADDKATLVAFYRSTGGDDWTTRTNWNDDSKDISEWFGVSTNANGRVFSLELDQNNLTGNIPAALGSLTSLTHLHLSRNSLTGRIPKELGNLTSLYTLNLHTNNLTGGIPPELGNLANLSQLLLGGNANLRGPIPPELGNLANLSELFLFGNGHTGALPNELGNLDNLLTLFLSSNSLTGNIPKELGNLTNLIGLNLDYNGLTGAIPKELGKLTSLIGLGLGNNSLTGAIPKELGSLSSLLGLDLGQNRFTGTIPMELGELSSLEHLYLDENDLTGGVPPVLGDLIHLKSLLLDGNRLAGTVPKELGNLSSLWLLGLSENGLTGTIPREFGDLADLLILDLSGNGLRGTIPKELAELSSLWALALGANRLSGNIPPELGGLTNLRALILKRNSLTGAIPPELGDLFNLERLHLQDNDLSGQVPTALGGLSELSSFKASGTNRVCLPASLLEWHASLAGETDAIPSCGPTPATISLTVEPNTVVRHKTVTFRAVTSSVANDYVWTVGGHVVDNDSAMLEWSFEHLGWKTVTVTVTSVDGAGTAVADPVTASLAVEVLAEEDSRANVCTYDDPFRLCLHEGRFDVAAEFFDPSLEKWMSGRVSAFSRDTGFFTFFDRTNVEIMAKVLDACAINQRHWVFAGGATDLGVRLTVLDRSTATSSIYETEGGQPFKAITDITAFSCLQAARGTGNSRMGRPLSPPAERPTTGDIVVLPTVVLAGEQVTFRVESDGNPNRYTWIVDGAATETNAPILHWTFREPGPADIEVDVAAADDDGRYLAQPVVVRSRVEVIPVGHPDAGACRFPSSSKLCLNDGKFSATSEYQQPETGEWKPAEGRSLTRDSGYYTFFEPGNVEIFLKVLDACATSGQYWVYVGGATDLAVRVQVEHQPDSGGETVSRGYETARGPFVAIRDSGAFTCSR